MTNPLTDERRRDNLAYWQSKKVEYPFHAQAPTLDPSPTDFVKFLEHHHPDTHGSQVVGWFVAVPVGDGVTFWSFAVAAGRDAFLETYPQATELAAEAVFGNPV